MSIYKDIEANQESRNLKMKIAASKKANNASVQFFNAKATKPALARLMSKDEGILIVINGDKGVKIKGNDLELFEKADDVLRNNTEFKKGEVYYKGTHTASVVNGVIRSIY